VTGALALYARALLTGVAVAAPVGAITMLTLQRTLGHGAKAGYATGAGIATADAAFSALAAFGLTAVTSLMASATTPLRVVGALVLGWLGIRAILSKPRAAAEAGDPPNLPAQYGSAVALTLANPQTIITFAALFASMGAVAAGGGPTGAGVFVAGIFSGSLLWWVCLVTGVSLVRHRLSATAIMWIDRVSGAAILGFAVWMLASVLLAR
jgi:threonine/homoserine/homoserine lactone efflux protein